MNAIQIKEMKKQIKEMQTEIDYASNEAAQKILSTMLDTNRAYTASELSAITENVLMPFQVVKVMQAMMKSQSEIYSSKSIAKKVYGCNRRKKRTTKFSAIYNFDDSVVKVGETTQRNYSIACDENGSPLTNAEIKVVEKTVNTYQLVTNPIYTNTQEIDIF